MDERSKILIVDDERFYINVLVELLREDYKLFIAKNGAQALKRVQDNLPDVVLLDIQLPDIDGFQICSQLKAHPHWCRTQVIFLSAFNDAETHKKVIDYGGFACLSKPVDGELVKRLILNAINLES